MPTSVLERYRAEFPDDNVDASILSEEFMKSRLYFAVWYDAKSEDEQELIDEISDRTSFIIDEDEYDDFIYELGECGIETAQQFEYAFEGEWEGTGKEIYADFSQWLIESCWDVVPSIIQGCIDYELVWYSTLRFDYTAIEFKGNTYFFASI